MIGEEENDDDDGAKRCRAENERIVRNSNLLLFQIVPREAAKLPVQSYYIITDSAAQLDCLNGNLNI